MSIDALVTGRLHGKPSERTSKPGKAYVVCTVRATVRDDATLFVSVIGFKPAVVTALLQFEDGDPVSLAGELTPKIYQPPSGDPRVNLDLLCHAVISPYSVQRKRLAARSPEAQPQKQPLPFDDELPDLRETTGSAR